MNAEFVPNKALLNKLRTVYFAQLATESAALALVVYLIVTVNTLTYAVLLFILACVLLPAMYKQTQYFFSSQNTTAITLSGKHVLIHKRLGKSLYEVGDLSVVLEGNSVKLYVAGTFKERVDTRIFADPLALTEAFGALQQRN